MDALAIVVAVVGLLSVATYVYLHNRNYPPGPYGVPLLGYLPFFGTTIAETVFKLRNKYGNVVSISVGPKTVVILNDWKAIKAAFVRQGDVFSGRPLPQKSHTLSKKGLVYVDGPPWKAQKRATSHLLRQLGLVQPSLENIVIEEIEKLTYYLKAQDGKRVDIVDIFSLPTLNIALRTLAGKQYNRTDKDFAFVKKCIDNHNGHEVRKLSDLITTCYTLLLAIEETTEAVLQWAILCITYHQGVQKRIHEELDGLIATESILKEDSKALVPYTQAVLLEVLRFAPFGMLSTPHRAMKDTIVLGHKIPKDTVVFASMYAAHNDERYWKDPEVFRPERFLDEQGQVVRHECLVPFSAGPRICLGESQAKTKIFLMIVNLLHRFWFSFVPGEPKPIMKSNEDSLVRKPIPFSLVVKHRQ